MNIKKLKCFLFFFQIPVHSVCYLINETFTYIKITRKISDGCGLEIVVQMAGSLSPVVPWMLHIPASPLDGDRVKPNNSDFVMKNTNLQLGKFLIHQHTHTLTHRARHTVFS